MTSLPRQKSAALFSEWDTMIELKVSPLWKGARLVHSIPSPPKEKAKLPIKRREQLRSQNTHHSQRKISQILPMKSGFTMANGFTSFIGRLFKHVRSFTCFRRVNMFSGELYVKKATDKPVNTEGFEGKQPLVCEKRAFHAEKAKSRCKQFKNGAGLVERWFRRSNPIGCFLNGFWRSPSL